MSAFALTITVVLAAGCQSASKTDSGGYRWVKSGELVSVATGTYLVAPVTGSQGFFLATRDRQFTIQFPAGAIAFEQGEAHLIVRIDALDPTILRSSHAGIRFDGNAYRIRATYARSGKPAILRAKDCRVRTPIEACPVIVIRYPHHATGIWHDAARRWEPITSEGIHETRELIAAVPFMGAFVAASAVPEKSRLTPSTG